MKKNEAGLIEVEIDDKVYEFEKWDAESSLDSLMDISKLIGKPLGTIMGGVMGGGGIDQEFKPEMLAMAFEAISQSMDKVMVKDLIQKLTTNKVLCDGKQVKSFKIHYADSLMHMFKVVRANLEVQYKDFFDELLATAGPRAGKAVTILGQQT